MILKPEVRTLGIVFPSSGSKVYLADHSVLVVGTALMHNKDFKATAKREHTIFLYLLFRYISKKDQKQKISHKFHSYFST